MINNIDMSVDFTESERRNKIGRSERTIRDLGISQIRETRWHYEEECCSALLQRRAGMTPIERQTARQRQRRHSWR